MSIELKDEYSALRAEMLTRSGRIFDVIKVGSVGIVAVLAFQHTRPTKIEPPLLLVLVQFFLVAMTLVAINEFKHIYRIGTYLALACEGDRVNGWIRMSRSLGSFLASKTYESNGGDLSVRTRNERPFPWGERWGEDPIVFAIAILVLSVLSWTSGALVATNSRELFGAFFIPVFPTICLLYLLHWLFNGIETYRQQTEKAWKLHFASWRSKFPDEYAASTRVDINHSP